MKTSAARTSYGPAAEGTSRGQCAKRPRRSSTTAAKSASFRRRLIGMFPESLDGVRGDGPTMLTNAITATGYHALPQATAAQKVVIVNGSTEILELLETVVDAGNYDIVFVESTAHAYSQIKRVQPNLVILCVRIEDLDAFQVLSMLKIDIDTREIPVLTYTTEYEGQETEEDFPDAAEPEIFSAKPMLRMN
jgi:CheY-like chemotaxis protein